MARKDNPYFLYMEDPEILYKLEKLAQDNDSILSQRDGSALTPYTMNDGKALQVVTLTAAPEKIKGIESKLREMGVNIRQFSSATENGPIKIEINIQLE